MSHNQNIFNNALIILAFLFLFLGCQSTDRTGKIEIAPEASRFSYSSMSSATGSNELICKDVFLYFDQKQIYQPGPSAYLLVSNLSEGKIMKSSTMDLRSLGYTISNIHSAPAVCTHKSFDDFFPSSKENPCAPLTDISVKSTILIENLGTIYSRNIQDSHHDYNYWRVDLSALESINSEAGVKNWQVGLKNCNSTRQMTRAEFAGLVSLELRRQLKVLFSRNEPFIETDFLINQKRPGP